MSVRYIKDRALTWRRVKNGFGFLYLTRTGKRVAKNARKRIEALGIPPAWKEVAICPSPYGHIQAIGVDRKGRKQYIYHPLWVKKNQEKKFDQMVFFGERLPTLRETVSAHMREHTLTRDRIIATVVWLLEHTFIRVGNEEYAKENNSYGLTTMREKHVLVEGNTVTFSFKGKSGIFHQIGVTHPRVAKTLKACIELPGYKIFQYIDEGYQKRSVDSGDINEYLRGVTGKDFSAKDFRTWGGSVMAGDNLYKSGQSKDFEQVKKNISKTLQEVSEHLGNTKVICRKYYVHPAIISSYEKNILVPFFGRFYRKRNQHVHELTKEERATWSLIKNV